MPTHTKVHKPCLNKEVLGFSKSLCCVLHTPQKWNQYPVILSVPEMSTIHWEYRHTAARIYATCIHAPCTVEGRHTRPNTWRKWIESLPAPRRDPNLQDGIQSRQNVGCRPTIHQSTRGVTKGMHLRPMNIVHTCSLRWRYGRNALHRRCIYTAQVSSGALQ
jgi:hypothetical protein